MNKITGKKSQITRKLKKILCLYRSSATNYFHVCITFNQLHRLYCVELRCRSIAMIARKTLITVFEANNLFPDLHPELVFVQVPRHQRILLLKKGVRFFECIKTKKNTNQYSLYLVQTHTMHAAMVADEQPMDCMVVEDVLHIEHLTLTDHETCTDNCLVVVGMTMSSIPAM